jgi:hypothetical protein
MTSPPSHPLPDFASWDHDRLARFTSFLIHNYRVMDAFWFISIEKDHGIDEACRLNEVVWGRVGNLAARDLKARFDIAANGLEGFVTALGLFPWTMLVGYQIEALPGEVVIRVPSCPPQAARLERGLGEYACRAMHQAEFEGFAREIDPRIQVRCDFAPLDDHPPDCFCQWRFSLNGM